MNKRMSLQKLEYTPQNLGISQEWFLVQVFLEKNYMSSISSKGVDRL